MEMATTASAVARVPVLEGKPWHITGYPDLGDLADPAWDADHEVVDHTIWQSHDRKWHVWACVRGTRVGRRQPTITALAARPNPIWVHRPSAI